MNLKWGLNEYAASPRLKTGVDAACNGSCGRTPTTAFVLFDSELDATAPAPKLAEADFKKSRRSIVIACCRQRFE